MWYFLCDSDLHFGVTKDEQGNLLSRKPNQIAKIQSLHTKYGLDLLLCVGDSLNNAADGSKLGGCCQTDPNGNQYQALITQYINPIEQMGIPVKVCVGNHDIDRWKYINQSILKLIRDRYGGTYSWFDFENSSCYTFIHKNIQFICMGVYPKNLTWLQQHLPVNKYQPIVIYYHFNTNPVEPFSDWWTAPEKEAFYNLISTYNIQLIVNGHWHTSKKDVWRGMPYIICADNPVIVEVNGDTVTARLT